jgi:hypothetical protein
VNLVDDPSLVQAISYFDAATGRYFTYMPGIMTPGSMYDFTVMPGSAYVIEVYDTARIVYPGSM